MMRLLLIMCCAVLFLGLANLPIGYYKFLRISISIGALAVIITEINEGLTPWSIIFGMILIFFNPIFPIYLNKKSAWLIPDILAALVFLTKYFFVSNQPKAIK